MGMTIEELVAENDKLKRQLAYESTALTMMKADYKARLKADLAAMLTELQLDIEECVDGGEGSPQFEEGVAIARTQVVKMIQQKINDLKGEIC